MSTDRDRWNSRHRQSLGQPLDQPSAWLKEQEELLVSIASAGETRALDLACGRGRNAVYLADLGFIVDAVDVSDIAVSDLQERVRRRGLSIHARAADMTIERPSPLTYELVVVFRYLDRALMSSLARALKPGGALVYETFLASPVKASSMNPAFLLQPGELPGLFPDLETLIYQETVPGLHLRERPTARLVARHPKLTVLEPAAFEPARQA